jgi:hypothetical protein
LSDKQQRHRDIEKAAKIISGAAKSLYKRTESGPENSAKRSLEKQQNSYKKSNKYLEKKGE